MGIFDDYALVEQYIKDNRVNYYPTYYLVKDGVVMQVTDNVAFEYQNCGTIHVFKHTGRGIIALK